MVKYFIFVTEPDILIMSICASKCHLYTRVNIYILSDQLFTD